MSEQGRGRGRYRGGQGGGVPRGEASGRGGDGELRGGHRGGFDGNRGGDRGGHRGDRGGFNRGGGRGSSQTMTYRPRVVPGIYLEGESVPQPDAASINAEDARVKLTRGKIIEGFPGRPGYGTAGTKIVLRTNFFELIPSFEAGSPEIPLYRYSIKTLEDLSKPKTRRLFELILKTPSFLGANCASDYSSFVVADRQLDIASSPSAGFTIELHEANEPAFPPASPSDTQQVQDARRDGRSVTR